MDINQQRRSDTPNKNLAPKKNGGVRGFMCDIFQCIMPAVVTLFLLKCVFTLGHCVSGSMSPTVRTGDTFFGSQAEYWFGDPDRGDVITFHGTLADGQEAILLKRVIGLPGDTVQVVGGLTYINGACYNEPYLLENTINEDTEAFQVPAGCYFVMGDCRDNSYDSRYWDDPFVKREDVFGHIWLTFSDRHFYVVSVTKSPSHFLMLMQRHAREDYEAVHILKTPLFVPTE